MVSEGSNIVHQGRATVRRGPVPIYTATAQSHSGIMCLLSLLVSKLDKHTFCRRNVFVYAKLSFSEFEALPLVM